MRTLCRLGLLSLTIMASSTAVWAQDGGGATQITVTATDIGGTRTIKTVDQFGNIETTELGPGSEPITISSGRSKGEMLQEIQQRASDRLRQQLGAPSDDEWAVLQPKIERISALRAAAGEAGGPVRAASGASADDDVVGRVQTAMKKLQGGISTSAIPGELIQLMTAFRNVRQEARDTLRDARKDLQALVTTTQEAVLLRMGILD